MTIPLVLTPSALLGGFERGAGDLVAFGFGQRQIALARASVLAAAAVLTAAVALALAGIGADAFALGVGVRRSGRNGDVKMSAATAVAMAAPDLVMAGLMGPPFGAASLAAPRRGQNHSLVRGEIAAIEPEPNRAA